MAVALAYPAGDVEVEQSLEQFEADPNEVEGGDLEGAESRHGGGGKQKREITTL